MIYNIYAIRDLKTGFMSLTLDQNDPSAMRNFKHACMNTQSLFFTHPEDYALYCLGEFDTDEGQIYPKNARILMYATDSFKRSPKKRVKKEEIEE